MYHKAQGADITSQPADESYHLSDAEFERVARLVRSVCGIVIEAHKKQMVYARLSRRLRALNLQTFDAYLSIVERGDNPAELQSFINAVTTNLTSFFRENHHFEHFRTHVLEPKSKDGSRRLRVWSAGCSTGEEPHCIAMTLLSVFSSPPSDFKVLATDIDTRVLATSETGVYPLDKLDGIPQKHHSNIIIKKDRDCFEFSPNIKRLLHFKRLNLLEKWPVSGPFDVIFCRNVLIYFDAEVKARIISDFAKLLGENGYLYLGHSESILGNHPLLKSLGRTIYQRVA